MSDDLAARLSEPFETDEVRWKPQAVSGNRALAIAYVDARVVMDRLDEALGVGGWQTAYRVGEDGVFCRLRARVGGEWVEHEDVGSYSEQPDDGDKLKAAVSDSLKRAAVHLGVGRYLYRLPQQWVDFDPQKKRIVRPPALPAWARPGRKAALPAPAPPPAPPPAKAEPAVDVAYEVKVWTDWLATRPDVEAFNQTLRADLPGADPAVRRQAWVYCKGYANDRGWEFDDKAKAFFAPEPEGPNYGGEE